MGTRTIMWLFLGAILLIAGLISSVRDGKDGPARHLPRPDARVIPARLSDARPAAKVDAGFLIDPVKGLRRKEDQNANYFS